MLKKFKNLIDTYALKELDMSALREIERSGIVSFDNHGISRSNKDCLLCVLTCVELSDFKKELLNCNFDSYERYEAFIQASGFDFEVDSSSEVDYIVHRDKEGFYEFACSIEPDGKVNIESEDVQLQETFHIYLRVQHPSSKL